MDSENQQAPPVVAVVVVHEPGPWFDEVLDAFARQDYPNLRMLFLPTATDDDLNGRIRSRCPGAFIRPLDANPGFGTAANEVAHLVEGENGFFLICHDDIAPDPSAVRLLVEEIYRSNAGVVGPKLVEWDDANVLQAVGLGLDRFGEVDQLVEPGERDQEQHDGVRDVFVVPSACMLVRADLFRAMGGFDPTISFHGDDVEFCWRVHHSGARVIVVPSARVRHRGELPDRRPDLNHTMLAARHRMRGVATLTGAGRLPGRLVVVLLLTLGEMVVGVFTGRLGQAWASLRALGGLLPRAASVARRRRVVTPLRQVPEREVIGLQTRGSARLAGYLRNRESSAFVGAEATVRRWRGSSTGPVVAWLAVIALLLIGSRDFLTNGVPAVGEFLRLPESPREFLASYISSWNEAASGSTTASPTGWATLSALSVSTLFRMGLLHTLFVVGLVLVGAIGAWKLATVFPSNRARIGALVVYAASPLVAGAMSTGRLTTLVAYASTPWIVHSIRRTVGVGTADPRAIDSDLSEAVTALTWPERLQRGGIAVVVVGLAAAFAPIMVVVTVVIAVLLAVGTVLALAPWRSAVGYLLAGLAAAVGGTLLNFPWFTTWTWDQMVGPPPVGAPGRGLLALATFETGLVDFAGLALALYLPVVAAIALGMAWRLTWAVRAGVLVVGFGALAVMSDRNALPFDGPEAGVLLAPVMLGLSISAAAALAVFDLDVRGGSFGWRQPLGLVANLAVVIGIFPGVAALADGAWNTPDNQLSVQIEQLLPDVDGDASGDAAVPTGSGDYNVLLIGDARLLPVPSTEYRDGVSFAVVDDGEFDIRDRWARPVTDLDEAVRLALDELSASTTLRAGRLLAPLGIRYLVAPEFDNVLSTTTDPIEQPAGLARAMQEQLDLIAVEGFVTLDVYENTAWVPTFSQLTGDSAAASGQSGLQALVAEAIDASPVFVGADASADTVDDVEPGTVHLAIPFDDHWRLDVDGQQVDARRAFGVTTAFDVDRAGSATLSYRSDPARTVLLLVQVAFWAIAVFLALRVDLSFGRRRPLGLADETLIDLDAEDAIGATPIADPGLDVTSRGLARPAAQDIPDDDHLPDDQLPVDQPLDVELPDDQPLDVEPVEPTVDDGAQVPHRDKVTDERSLADLVADSDPSTTDPEATS